MIRRRSLLYAPAVLLLPRRGLAQVPMTGAGLGVTSAGGDIVTGLTNQWFMDDSHIGAGPDRILDSVGTSPFNLNTSAVTSASTSAIAGGAQFSTCRAFDGTVNSLCNDAGTILNTGWTSANTLGGWIFPIDITAVGQNATRASYFGTSDGVADTNMARVCNDTATANGTLAVYSPNGTGLSTASPVMANSTWIQFAFTYDGVSTKKLYVNGVQVSTIGTSGGVQEAGTHFNGIDVAGDGASACRLYNWVLYNRALSAADVAKLFAAR
jgi:hypothetical protein